MNMSEQVILVDKDDHQVGVMPKLEAHEKGLLHRAFSIFIFNTKGELLLQQRAVNKYHSAGLWSNTCCSHPAPGETLEAATQRRLLQEMGISCDMKHQFSFIYQAGFVNGLIEHEFDHVYFGYSDAIPAINIKEVMNWKYMEVAALVEDVEKNSENYTEWLKDCLEKVVLYSTFVKTDIN